MLRLLEILVVTLFETIGERRKHGPARPSWDFRFEWVVRFLRRDFLDSAGWPYERLRRDLDARHYPSKALPRVRVSETRVGGVPAVEFTPPEPRRSGVLLYFHGGSYIFGSARRTHADIIASLALGAGVRAIGPSIAWPRSIPIPRRSRTRTRCTTPCSTPDTRPSKSWWPGTPRAAIWRWRCSCRYAIEASRRQRPRS